MTTDSTTARPLRDLVLLRPSINSARRVIKRDDGSSVSLVLTTDAQYERPYGRVLAVGPDVRHVSIDDYVLFDSAKATRFSGDDVAKGGYARTGNPGSSPDASVLIAEADIIAVIDPDEEA